MEPKKQRRLLKLARSVETSFDYFTEIMKWPRKYGVPFWSRADYAKLFEEARSSTGLI